MGAPFRRRVSSITPDKLPGLAAWYSADYGVLTSVGPDVAATDGQTVRRWLDRSGNGRHLDQTTLALQPSFSGGRIVFNRATTNSLSATGGGPWTFAGGGAIYCVVKPTSAAASSYGCIVGQFTGAGTSLAWHTQDFPNSGLRHTLDAYANRSTSKEAGTLSVETAESFVWDNWQTGAGITGATGKSVNILSSTGSGSPSSLPSGAFYVGRSDPNIESHYNGSIAELVCLTSPARPDALAKYLSRKWGIAL